uniref:Large proline-rich protein BAG6 n=1 Tax=Lygus hesperus TaxID=30085 RepID=A0A0K8TD43_LYGHE
MIEVTIKTLDSRNHAFTVGDEFTVKQLKEHIAESVNVPAESQRLIYCGRVLVDDKKLSEYDVNGKVIHLVQRAPPSSSGDTGNSGSEPRPSGRRPFRATIFNQGGIRVDGAAGNAMYLGAMAFPADLVDAQGINLPSPRHVSQSRLAVVRSFIRRARYTLQNLENPARNDWPPEFNNAPPPPASNPAPAPMDFAFVAQALSDAVSRAAGNLPGSLSGSPIINVEVVSNGGERPSETASEPVQPPEEPAEPVPEPSTVRSDSPEASSATPPNTTEDQPNNARENGQRSRGSRFSRQSALADLVSQAMNIHTRLAPFLDRYYELLREDPALENHQEAQRLFNSVSELLHHMAHAYHAISDVMCDFSQTPPRLLQCRPVLIHHSAVLQTGIPIQLNLGGGSQSRGTATSGAEAERAGDEGQADSNGNSANAAPAPPPAGMEPRMSRRDRAESEGAADEPRRRERSERTPTPPREHRHGTARAFNLPAGGLEFIMDVGQGSIHIDSVEATVIPASGGPTGPSDGASSAPPELLNLWAALGQVTNIANRVASATSSSAGGSASDGGSQSATSSPPSNAANGNAASTSSTSRPLSSIIPGVQAWTNTETQPTTSTQTRATTRPHVHISPGGLQGLGMPGFFDPFLPCSSPHIRNHWRRSQNQDQESSQTQTGAQRARSNSENSAAGSNNASSTGGASHSHRGIRLTPDVTVVLQAPSRVSMEFPSGSPSLIDMIEASPQHAPEGTSLYADMFLALARHLTVSDVRELNFRHILTRARPHLSTFFRNRLTSGRDDTEGIQEGVARFNQDIRPLLDAALDSFDDIPMREDVDIIATITLVNSFFLPKMVMAIMSSEGDHGCFSTFRKFWMEYVHTLASVFHFCCLNGESDADNAFLRLGVRFLNAIPGLEIWAGYRVHRTVRQLLSELSPCGESVRDFVVYRMASGPVPPSSLNPEPSVATAAVTPPPSMDVVPPQSTTPQPMEVEDNVVVAEQLTEELPDVILDVHPDWVPIITRDRERQRRQAAQGPLSDAYLSGMPSKRRKIVSSNKPQGSLSRVISESMSSAISAAGVPVVENVAEAAASDSTVRSAYKEQVRHTVGATVKSHPDFKPDKYPNSSKLFNSK